MKTKLYTVICKILYKAGVFPSEVDMCMAWAFGPRAWYIPPACDPLHWEENWIDNWNQVHGKIMRIKRHDKLVEILYNVGVLFVSQRDQEQIRKEKKE